MTLTMGTGIAHDQRPQSTGPSALPGASLSGVDVPGTSGRALPLALGVCDVILQWKCHEVPTAPCPTTGTSRTPGLLGLVAQEQGPASFVHTRMVSTALVPQQPG